MGKKKKKIGIAKIPKGIGVGKAPRKSVGLGKVDKKHRDVDMYDVGI